MVSRIEIAEVVSFRLKVQRDELEALHRDLAEELALTLESEGSELVLGTEASDSHLRFRAIGAEAVLTEIAICNDERGRFFQRALGRLMVRGGGDLHARITWNVAEWNTHGEFAEVKVVRGTTTYPGLGDQSSNQLLPTAESAGALGAAPSGPSGGGGGAELPGKVPEQVDAEDDEIRTLLGKARSHWEEYQRLKAQRSS